MTDARSTETAGEPATGRCPAVAPHSPDLTPDRASGLPAGYRPDHRPRTTPGFHIDGAVERTSPLEGGGRHLGVRRPPVTW